MYDFCEAHASDGEGIESYLDPDTAVVEMVRFALEKDDPTICYLVRTDTGEVVAAGMFRQDRVLMVLRSDGILITHQTGVEA